MRLLLKKGRIQSKTQSTLIKFKDMSSTAILACNLRSGWAAGGAKKRMSIQHLLISNLLDQLSSQALFSQLAFSMTPRSLPSLTPCSTASIAAKNGKISQRSPSRSLHQIPAANSNSGCKLRISLERDTRRYSMSVPALSLLPVLPGSYSTRPPPMRLRLSSNGRLLLLMEAIGCSRQRQGLYSQESIYSYRSEGSGQRLQNWQRKT
ncbi:hypothetical protein FGO68_gene7613 [Halteria grandinella]|uniref:Uncharacterized protein n=1 Tax=Halteria grandinella TaxID=5974 RepID=A0A8J8NHX4_HALGN|nr:hypothetical protein FGO68_gene7613 [Halteria grandinella]